MGKSQINLFRLNCLIADRDLKGFKNVIHSFVCDYIYSSGNSNILLKDAFQYLIDLGISITWDVFNKVIRDAKYYDISINDSDVSICLKKEVFSDIEERIEKESLDAYIAKFVGDKHYDNKYVDAIKSMLYHSVYLNIMSFDTRNLSSLIPVNLTKKYEKDEIGIFNEFLDINDKNKNNAIFRIFLGAVEYAILTSGKGVSEYVRHIFKEKTYYLDANIILRLLGIDGNERQIGLNTIFNLCNKQGVKFKISRFSYKEVTDQIDSKITLLNKSVTTEGLAESIGDFIGNNKTETGFNYGFITNYAKVKIENKNVTDPTSYRFNLRLNLKKFQKKYNIDIEYNINIGEKETNSVAKLLMEEKRKLNKNVRYTKSASNVDASNIIFIKKLRGNNNYNFQDIKYFHLTTDGLLNQILQKDNELLAETILPSQLFILHNGLMSDDDEIDYALFVSFLKRRTTAFQLSGTEILKYIETIRIYTTDPTDIKDIMEVFVEDRYEISRKTMITDDDEIKTLREVTQSHLQKKLNNQDAEIEKYKQVAKQNEDFFKRAYDKFDKYFIIARVYSYLIEIGVIIFMGGILLIVGGWELSLISGISLFIIVEVIKYFMSDRFSFFNKLVTFFFNKKIKNSEYYQFSNKDILYLRKAEEYLIQKLRD